jgi:hypothetical protein
VHALRNIHAALVPGGIIVDTQPVSARPRVTADSVELGTADMRQWIKTIGRLDRRAAGTIRAGLYRLSLEEQFIVTDTFSSGPECTEIMRGWRDTQVPVRLERRLASVETDVEVHQQVRLRLLTSASEAHP